MPKGRSFYQTVTVDVDIDSSVLEENGYHHEEDCPGLTKQVLEEEFALEDNRKRLLEWHDRKHGLKLWTGCPYEPCSLLTEEFRSV